MYNSPAGGRSSWVDMDNNQICDTIRDMQRTMESTHRKVLSVCDNQKEFSGPNGWKASVRTITDQINELGRDMMEMMDQQFSKVYEHFENVQEDVKILQQKVTVLENNESNFEKRLEILERRPYRPDHNGLMHQYGLVDGPPPLVANRGPLFHHNHPLIHALQPAGYNSTLVPSQVTSGYNNIFPGIAGHVYASEHLPQEREALLRAVKKSAGIYGFKTTEANGIILVSTQADFSNAAPINNRQDLTRFCELFKT